MKVRSDQTPVRLPWGFGDPRASDFNDLAAKAANLGRAAIPALMLAARDGETLMAQLCAIKALGMISGAKAVDARRRISLLQLDGDRGVVLRAVFANPESSFADPWDADLVISSLRDAEWEPISFAEHESRLEVERAEKLAAIDLERASEQAATALERARQKAERERFRQDPEYIRRDAERREERNVAEAKKAKEADIEARRLEAYRQARRIEADTEGERLASRAKRPGRRCRFWTGRFR